MNSFSPQYSKDMGIGDIRSLMQRERLSRGERAQLWSVLQRSRDNDCDAHRDEVAPYLEGFPRHFEQPLARVTGIEGLERAVRVCAAASAGRGMKHWEVLRSSSLINRTTMARRV